jgi:hypothetical protein
LVSRLQTLFGRNKKIPELQEKYESELAIMSISIDPKEATKYILENKFKP